MPQEKRDVGRELTTHHGRAGANSLCITCLTTAMTQFTVTA